MSVLDGKDQDNLLLSPKKITSHLRVAMQYPAGMPNTAPLILTQQSAYSFLLASVKFILYRRWTVKYRSNLSHKTSYAFAQMDGRNGATFFLVLPKE